MKEGIGSYESVGISFKIPIRTIQSHQGGKYSPLSLN